MNETQEANLELSKLALESVRQLLPAKVQIEVSDYINEHNEWGLGVEVLIDAIAEEKITINAMQHQSLYAAASTMNLSNTLDVLSGIKRK